MIIRPLFLLQKGEIMQELFESIMVICFGISWPLSIIKSYRSKTTKGKSIYFILFILMGYGFGIASKLLSGNITYVFTFYVLNFIMVFIDICLYYRNLRLDKKKLLYPPKYKLFSQMNQISFLFSTDFHYAPPTLITPLKKIHLNTVKNYLVII